MIHVDGFWTSPRSNPSHITIKGTDLDRWGTVWACWVVPHPLGEQLKNILCKRPLSLSMSAALLLDLIQLEKNGR